MPFDNPYGGPNDRALLMVSRLALDEQLWLRAEKETGRIVVFLNCNDIFAWACADAEELPPGLWLEFEKSVERLRDKNHEWTAPWAAAAWAVKLRKVAPQKPATDRFSDFVETLDFLEIPWREYQRYDQMKVADVENSDEG